MAYLDRRHGVDLITETIMSNEPGTVTLVPTGPLTNIALAARMEPRIVDRVREVVLMGGGTNSGNRSATAEFNIVIDPEAAHTVFTESWPLTQIPIDVTHQALATPDVVERFTALATAPTRFVVELLDFFESAYRTAQGFEAPPVHDPCAVVYAIDSSIFTVRRAPISVELVGALTTGMTVADFRSQAPEGCTTQVAVGIDTARFLDLGVDAVERIREPG